MPVQKLEDEVARLQAINSELLKDKEEALPLLDAYRSACDFVVLLYLFCFASCISMCASQRLYQQKNLLCPEVRLAAHLTLHGGLTG